MAKRLLQTRNKMRVNKDLVSRKNVRDVEHIVVQGVAHMIADTTMNGIHYPRAEVEKLNDELANKRIVMPANHPEGDGGEFISASDPLALLSNHVGAYAYNFSMQGDKLISDVAIDPTVANMSEYGKAIVNAIQNGDPMDMSTGFYLNIEDKEGYAKDGEPYIGEASNLFMDHSAFLPDVAGAKNKAEGVGLHTNSAKDKHGNDIDTDVAELANNASTPAMQLPLAPNEYQWNESQAIARIKVYTNSNDVPSTSYRKFFLEFNQEDVANFDSYKQPFADIIDGVPHAVKQPLANSDTNFATSYNTRFAANKDGFISRALAWAKKMGYNDQTQTNDDGDRIMLKKLTAILNAANVKTDGLDDDAILAAYNTHMAKPEVKPEVKVNEAETPKWASDLVAQVNSLSAVVNANADEKLNEAVAAVVNLKKGIDEATAKNMGLVGCQNFLAANGVVSFNANSQTPKAETNAVSSELPE